MKAAMMESNSRGGGGNMKQMAHALSQSGGGAKDTAPVPHQRGAVGAKRAIPRHPNAMNDRHMVAGYRPNYKEGYQRQPMSQKQNRVHVQVSSPDCGIHTNHSRSGSKTAYTHDNIGRPVRRPSQSTYKSQSNNVYTQNPRTGQRDRSGIRSNLTSGNRRDASRGAQTRTGMAPKTIGGAGLYQTSTAPVGVHQISTELINQLKEELLQTWETYLIPDYHRTVFLDCIYGLTPDQYAPLIVKEIEDLQTEQSAIQSTIRAIIARESCLSQVAELCQVVHEAESMDGRANVPLLEECINILYSLRMLSLNVVKCIILWRKQLIFNFMLTQQTTGSGAQQQAQIQSAQVQRNTLRKFKCIPFVWEQQNYLLKMKTDTSFLIISPFGKYFNFSTKSDPFLVFPSMKQSAAAPGTNQTKALRRLRENNAQKLQIPLANTHMKLIRQSEVYLMEEAVTDTIIKGATQRIESFQQIRSQEHTEIFATSKQHQDYDGVGVVNVESYVNKQKEAAQWPYSSSNEAPEQVDLKEMSTIGPGRSQSHNGLEEFKTELNAEALVEDPGLVYRPLCSLSDASQNGQFHERDLLSMVSAYYDMLTPGLKQSFAPPESLVQVCMNGYDPHFLFLMSKNGGSGAQMRDRVRGLLVFNQEAALVRKPTLDEENCKVNISRETKVLLHHISALDENVLEEYVDQGLDYIWRTMHCMSIRINLHHYMQDDEKNPGQQKLKGNETLKSIFKKRVFRWKTLKNELGGMRIETWEGANCLFKEQLKPDTAFMYRRGLAKADISKDSVNICIRNDVKLGAEPDQRPQQASTPSLSSLISDLIDHRKKQETLPALSASLDLTAEDHFSAIRTKMSNSCKRDCMEGIVSTLKAQESNFTSVAMAQGRFFSVDSCQHAVDQTVYQYARIKKTLLMCFKSSDASFSSIFVVQNNDGLMNFIFLVKAPQYSPKTDEQVLSLLKGLSGENCAQLDYLWVPAFALEQAVPHVTQIEGIQLTKDDPNSFVNDVSQVCSAEVFCLPESDGTPRVTPDYPALAADKMAIVESSFIFVANQVSLDESIELPLAIMHVDKSAHWKRL